MWHIIEGYKSTTIYIMHLTAIKINSICGTLSEGFDAVKRTLTYEK